MFVVGMGTGLNAVFALSTMLIAVPTGIKIFNWLATMYGGHIRFRTPMLFCCAFLFQFLCAGLTGVMLSVAPFDWQLSDSYFVVAHFHFVLIGGLLFAIFAAIYYWFPKVTGRMLSERLRPRHFLRPLGPLNPSLLPHHSPPRPPTPPRGLPLPRPPRPAESETPTMRPRTPANTTA